LVLIFYHSARWSVKCIIPTPMAIAVGKATLLLWLAYAAYSVVTSNSTGFDRA